MTGIELDEGPDAGMAWHFGQPLSEQRSMIAGQGAADWGMVIDVEARRPILDGRGGGLSGPAIHPVAVRAVHDVHAALPDLPIVGVGGVTDAVTAVELLLAGASAVQVGTATFADPRSVASVRDGVEAWCQQHDVAAVRDLIGAAHAR